MVYVAMAYTENYQFVGIGTTENVIDGNIIDIATGERVIWGSDPKETYQEHIERMSGNKR